MAMLDYFAPLTLGDALERLQREGDKACVIAGGTNLMLALRQRSIEPALLIDLKSLPMAGITVDKTQVVLGARVTFSQILQTTALATHFPALVQACNEIGGPPIRNRGTLGGNLVNASPAADTAVPLLVYDSAVVLDRVDSQRIIPLESFFLEPGGTLMTQGELLTEIRIPRPPPKTASRFLKLGLRRAMAIAIASVAVYLTLTEEGNVSIARIALGSVAPRPIRAYAGEEQLNGYPLTQGRIEQAAREAADQTAPITDMRASAAYRKRMAEVLTRRALTGAWQDLEEVTRDV